MPARATRNILVTGAPGVGKTTLIMNLADALADRHPVGFFTEEICVDGIRQGFHLTSFDGEEGMLAHVDIDSPHRVGKYGVDVAGFETFLDTVRFFAPDTQLVMLDEIGKMECISEKFRTLLGEILSSNRAVAASITLKGDHFTTAVKKRPDVKLFTVTRGNREALVGDLASLLL